MNKVSAFAPASIGNVSCGFDTLGLCLAGLGDIVTVERIKKKTVIIESIKGASNGIPLEADKNCASVAILSYLNAENLTEQTGISITIEKGIPCGSGLGSSAASAVAAVVAIRELFNLDTSDLALLEYALVGEKIASQSEHYDNIAPSLFGGITLTTHNEEKKVVSLPIPIGLSVAIAHPEIVIKTAAARDLIPQSISTHHAVAQMSDIATFTAALYSNDISLLETSLKDRIAEPYRKKLIPHYDLAREAAFNAGAISFSIAGAGPAMFSFISDDNEPNEVAQSIAQVFIDNRIGCSHYSCKIPPKGAYILKENSNHEVF